MTRNPGSTDVQELRYERLSPRHQLQLQSSLDLPDGIELDWRLRYVSELPAAVDAYATSNVRLSLPLTAGLAISVVGQDLHAPHHLEWPGSGGATVEVRRSGYVGLTWRR